MKGVRLSIGILVALVTASPLAAQSYRSTVNEGNDLYRQKQYDRAKDRYTKATGIDKQRMESYYNLGNASYRADDYTSAGEAYKHAGSRARSREQGAKIWYNAGDTFLGAADKLGESPGNAGSMGSGGTAGPGGGTEDARMEAYRHAIRSFKESLKLDPKDEDARYNLLYAMKQLRDLQQKKQNQKNQKQQNKNDKQDRNKKKDKQKQNQQNRNDQKKQQQQQQQQQQNGKQNNDRAQQQPRQHRMSKEQAEQILNALQRDEKKLQEKLRAKQAVRVNVDKDW